MSIRILTLTAALLVGGGCVSYSYHSSNGGDYYSGTPSVEYRYIGGYYGTGYSPYWYGGYGYPGYYGYGGYPYYGHRYHGYYGGYPYWGSPYYYGGAWGYRRGPYKPPQYNPPPVNPPTATQGTLRYLDSPNDARRYPGHRQGAGPRYGVPSPTSTAGGVQRPPSRAIPPPPQLTSPPPAAPRTPPPARPLPPPARAVSPSSAGSEARATPYSPKGATRSRSRYLDPDDP